jgi:hypothetical protein
MTFVILNASITFSDLSKSPTRIICPCLGTLLLRREIVRCSFGSQREAISRGCTLILLKTVMNIRNAPQLQIRRSIERFNLFDRGFLFRIESQSNALVNLSEKINLHFHLIDNRPSQLKRPQINVDSIGNLRLIVHQTKDSLLKEPSHLLSIQSIPEFPIPSCQKILFINHTSTH